METDKPVRPPVDVEQWLDFIIAAASHRSRDEAQRKFGELLIERYYANLRDEYKDDPVSRAYLDNMLCAVASAIRGFSVVRDMFATNWETIMKAKERERARAERIDNFAPFKKDGYWKPALAVIGALGLLSPILAGFGQSIGNLPWILVMALAGVFLMSLFGTELLVDWIRNRRLAKLEDRFPDDLLEFWQDRSLRGYRVVSRQFLLSAMKIREEFYPSLTTLGRRKVFESYPVPHIDCGVSREPAQGDLEELEQHLAAIVEQHFAFKLKSKLNEPPQTG